MTEHELTILISGMIIGFIGSAAILIIGFVILTIKEKIEDIKYKREHRLENLMMAEAERGLDERDG